MAKSVSKSTTTPKKKGAKIPVAVPTHIADASACLRALKAFLDKVETLEADAESAKAKIDARLESDVAPLMQQVVMLTEQAYGYAEAHRTELAQGTKTAPLLEAGTVEWATTPPAVSIEDVEQVIQRCRNLGKVEFIRKRPDEIDKDAMLKDIETARAIEGVTIDQVEKVYVKPAGTRARVESTIGKRGKPGKWKAVWPKTEVSE